MKNTTANIRENVPNEFHSTLGNLFVFTEANCIVAIDYYGSVAEQFRTHSPLRWFTRCFHHDEVL